jgi:hypothetical protein
VLIAPGKVEFGMSVPGVVGHDRRRGPVPVLRRSSCLRKVKKDWALKRSASRFFLVPTETTGRPLCRKSLTVEPMNSKLADEADRVRRTMPMQEEHSSRAKRCSVDGRRGLWQNKVAVSRRRSDAL